MSRFHSYLASAVKIIETHAKGEPLALHLKRFFSSDKKYGSRDRKFIGNLCYNYYRLGKALPAESIEKKIICGIFLCEDSSSELVTLLPPEKSSAIDEPLEKKLLVLDLLPGELLQYTTELSNSINEDLFCLSLLVQPNLFVRIRPGNKEAVENKLRKASIPYCLTGDCIMVDNSTPLDKIIIPDKEVVIQDMNSQKVLDRLDTENFKGPVTAWDCCAASGGKSILLYDKLQGKVELTVSDIRENILVNLTNRLQNAGVKLKKKFRADLTVNYGNEKFNIIICDVPCTGSGTWARTPEQLTFFDLTALESYSSRQQQIVLNASRNLAHGGLFFYITCSVFKKENEDMAFFISDKCSLSLLEMKYHRGYDMRADTLFVAVFTS